MTESTRHGIAPHHIVDHLAAAGVGCGDAVLVCIGDRRTREAVIDNANSAGHAVLVPLVASDRPGIEDLAVAVGAAAVVTDRSVPLPLTHAPCSRRPRPHPEPPRPHQRTSTGGG